MSPSTTEPSQDLYGVLGVERTATETEVRRAFKTLITKEHPDKGGNPERFKLIKLSYDTLSNKIKREYYDKSGKVSRTAGEEFMDKFRGGSFGAYATQPQDKENLAEALTVLKKPDQSHTAGFEAWMRSRGEAGTTVFTADSMAEQFGVMKGSYDVIPLPQISAYQAVCEGAGPLQDTVRVCQRPLPAGLEWGQVLVSMKYAPVDAADAHTSLAGGVYAGVSHSLPYVAGHQGVGVVVKVGAGVKGVREDDWVIPLKSHSGTWQTMAVAKAADLLVIPKECMPLEYASCAQQLCLAYKLLEDFGRLKPGDCVILNAATSAVGQTLVQLCYALQLRTVAVVTDGGAFEKTALWLKGLGATEVVRDSGSVKAELGTLRFFAKPKLALDAVGGASALRITDCLAEGGQVVIYGCLSGKAPMWPWQSWVFNSLKVCGFNLRSWMTSNQSSGSTVLAGLGRLISAEQLRITFAEYDLSTELEEAVAHALDRGTHAKVLLRMGEVSVSPEAE